MPQGRGHHDKGSTLTPPVADAVASAFTRFNADLNTTIALSELLAVLDPQGTHARFDTRLGTLFKQLDSNGDTGVPLRPHDGAGPDALG